MDPIKTLRLCCTALFFGLFIAHPSAGAQDIDLAGKTFVIEGVYRGFNALERDSIQLVRRNIPRAHDYLEFYTDSTFHFNYRSVRTTMGNQPYRKVNWAPGRWTFNSRKQIVTLTFDDNNISKSYAVRMVSNNIYILLKVD